MSMDSTGMVGRSVKCIYRGMNHNYRHKPYSLITIILLSLYDKPDKSCPFSANLQPSMPKFKIVSTEAYISELGKGLQR